MRSLVSLVVVQVVLVRKHLNRYYTYHLCIWMLTLYSKYSWLLLLLMQAMLMFLLKAGSGAGDDVDDELIGWCYMKDQ